MSEKISADEELAERIKNANREVYNNIDPENYNLNESIFNERRKQWCSDILRRLSQVSGEQAFLDIGCGTGNLLRLARERFSLAVGLDIGDRLLAKVQNEFPDCRFVAGDAEGLPFADASFDCVSCHAVLHHLYDHKRLLAECHRTLRKGGALYTDHDPNYHFNRYYHFLYKLWYRGRHGFGSAIDDLAEYHHVFSPGINPDAIVETLESLGFNDIDVRYRHSDNENFHGLKRLVLNTLKLVSKWIPWRGFFTHFTVLARKS